MPLLLWFALTSEYLQSIAPVINLWLRAAMAPMAASVLCVNAFCRPNHAALVRPRALQPHSRGSLSTLCQATAVEFTKYQGLGNDFILVSKWLFIESYNHRIHRAGNGLRQFGRWTTGTRRSLLYPPRRRSGYATGILASVATGYVLSCPAAACNSV